MPKTKSKKEKDKPASKETPKKLILCELVEAYPEENWVIIGALHSVGLLEQYNHELEIYGYETITPSITVEEFDKIIKTFLGE